MEVTAKARYLRVSPKKVRLVIDVVRGMDVVPAQHELEYMKKDAKKYVVKLLDSAVANAEHNFELKRDNLYIKKITADGGPVLHRWRARAHGRAGSIQKKTTHLLIVLDERVPTEKKSVKKAKPSSTKVAGDKKKEKTVAKKVSEKKTAVKKETIKSKKSKETKETKKTEKPKKAEKKLKDSSKK